MKGRSQCVLRPHRRQHGFVGNLREAAVVAVVDDVDLRRVDPVALDEAGFDELRDGDDPGGSLRRGAPQRRSRLQGAGREVLGKVLVLHVVKGEHGREPVSDRLQHGKGVMHQVHLQAVHEPPQRVQRSELPQRGAQIPERGRLGVGARQRPAARALQPESVEMAFVADEVVVVATLQLLQRRDEVAEIALHPSHRVGHECHRVENYPHRLPTLSRRFFGRSGFRPCSVRGAGGERFLKVAVRLVIAGVDPERLLVFPDGRAVIFLGEQRYAEVVMGVVVTGVDPSASWYSRIAPSRSPFLCSAAPRLMWAPS